MTQYHVAIVDRAYRVYATEDGITRTYLGPRHATPRDAAQWADMIQAMRSADDAGVPPQNGSPDEIVSLVGD